MSINTANEPLYLPPDEGTFHAEYERAKKAAMGQGSLREMWKPLAGPHGHPARNIIRIMPRRPDMKDVIVGTKMHFSLGPSHDNAGVCRAVWGQDCEGCKEAQYYSAKAAELDQVIAAEQDQSRKKGLQEEQERLSRLSFDKSANGRNYANIIDETTPETRAKGIQPYPFGPTVNRGIRACFYDDRQNYRNITDPNKGRCIIMDVQKKTASSKFNEYVLIRPEESDSSMHDLNLLKELPDLNQFLRCPTAEEMHELVTVPNEQREANRRAAFQQRRPGGGGFDRQGWGGHSSSVSPPPAEAAPPSSPPVSASQPTSSTPPPTPVSSTVASSPPAPTPPSATASVRQPVEDPPPSIPPSDPTGFPWTHIKEIAKGHGFTTPTELTLKQLEVMRKPPCYTKEWLPGDTGCHRCKLYLPCGHLYLVATEKNKAA